MSDVNIEFGANIQGVQHAIVQLKTNLNSLSINFASFTTSIKDGLNFASSFFEFAKGIVLASSELEKIEARLRSYTATAEDANIAAQISDEFGRTPPFSAESAEVAIKALLASGTGILSLGKELKILGNIASAAGIPLETMAQKIALSSQTGSVGMRELRDIAKGGVPIFEELSKVTGLSMDSLEKALGNGSVSFKVFKTSLQNLGGDGGQFGGAMENLLGNLPGKITALQGQWEDVRQEFALPISEALSPLIDSLLEKIKKLVPIAKECGIALAWGAQEIIPSMVEIGGKFNDIITGSQTSDRVIRGLVGAFLILKTGVASSMLKAQAAVSSFGIKVAAETAKIKLLLSTTAGVGRGFTAVFQGLKTTVSTVMAACVARVKSAAMVMKSAMATAFLAILPIIAMEGVSAATKNAHEAQALWEDMAGRSMNQGRERDSGLTAISQVKTEEEAAELRESFLARRKEIEDEIALSSTKGETERAKALENEILLWSFLVDRLDAVKTSQINAATAVAQAAEEEKKLAQVAEESAKKEEALLKKQIKNLEEATRLKKQMEEKERDRNLETMNLGDQEKSLQEESSEILGKNSNQKDIDEAINSLNEQARISGKLTQEQLDQLGTLYRIKESLAEINVEKKKLEADQKKELVSYQMSLDLIDAELKKDREKLEALKQQQRIYELINEYKEKGFSDEAAGNMAFRLSEKESDLGKFRDSQKNNTTTFVTSSKGALGTVGGNSGFGISNNPQTSILSTSNKQLSIQQDIKKMLEKMSNSQSNSGGIAIIGK